MSLITKKKTKAIRRSTSAPHQTTDISLLAPSGSAAGSSSPLVPRSPSGSSGDEAEAQQPPSQFFRSLKLGKGKAQTWSPEDPPRQRHHSPAGGGFPSTSSSSSGEVKTSSPSRARRASKMFRKLGGSRIVAPSNHHHQHEVASASPSAVTPPLWLPLVDFLCRAVEQHGKLGLFLFLDFLFQLFELWCSFFLSFFLCFSFVLINLVVAKQARTKWAFSG
jgi:hypothetical protein